MIVLASQDRCVAKARVSPGLFVCGDEVVKGLGGELT